MRFLLGEGHLFMLMRSLTRLDFFLVTLFCVSRFCAFLVSFSPFLSFIGFFYPSICSLRNVLSRNTAVIWAGLSFGTWHSSLLIERSVFLALDTESQLTPACLCDDLKCLLPSVPRKEPSAKGSNNTLYFNFLVITNILKICLSSYLSPTL